MRDLSLCGQKAALSIWKDYAMAPYVVSGMGRPFQSVREKRKFITAAYGASLNVLKEILIGSESSTAEGK